MAATPRTDKALGQKQRAGNDWFGHVSHSDERPDTPRSGRGTGQYAAKYAGESDKWYTYDKSPTKDVGAASVADELASGDAPDTTLPAHETAFVEEPPTAAATVEAAAPVEAEPEPAPVSEPTEAAPAETESVPKLELSGSEHSSPKKSPSGSPTKTPKGQAKSYKERGSGMSEDWYHYSNQQIKDSKGGSSSDNAPVPYSFDVKSLKSDTQDQAQGYKNRNKGSASDWYSHGGEQGSPKPQSSPKKEVRSPVKDEIDANNKESVKGYAAKAKQGSATDWFGHSGGEYTPRKAGKPRVTTEGQSFAERNQGTFSIFGQQDGHTEPQVHTSRGGANKQIDSVGGLLGGK